MNKKNSFLLLAILLSFIQFALSDGYKVPQYAYGLAVCDIDNDGDIDIVVGSDNQGNDTISILLNDGYGNFTWSYFTRSNHTKIFCSCMDADDLPDIVSVSSSDFAWVFYPNLGNGNFSYSQVIYSTSTETIDLFSLDQDNSLDFVCYDQNPVGILGALYNDGFGFFAHKDIFTSTVPISAPDVGDLNGDGLNDIISATPSVGAMIFYNQGNGVFNQQVLDIISSPYTYIFDIDNDGDNDIGLFDSEYFPGEICTLRLYENQGDNFVLQDTILFPVGTLFQNFSDFNNDGYFDIVYMRSYWKEPVDSFYVVLNNHHLGFSSPDRYFVSNPGLLSVKAADFDGNGYKDLAYTYYNWQDSITILYNDGTGKFVENPLTSIMLHESKSNDINVFPNPFSLNAKIRIENKDHIRNPQKYISICDIRGNVVRIFSMKEINSASDKYEIVWDGRDQQGNQCCSGVYFLKCIIGNLKYFTKIILVNNSLALRLS
jgi:hypothetical protein